MSSSIANNPHSSELLETLETKLQEASLKDQLETLPQLMAAGPSGWQVLLDFLRTMKAASQPTIIAGRSLQYLTHVEDEAVQAFLTAEFPEGMVPLPAACQVDYTAIQRALIQADYELADRLTLQKMCALAGPLAEQRKWLYFTEVRGFPVLDLQVLDYLWWIYSEGKFGFAKQREIWLGVGQNWDQFWPRIAWKDDNTWTRYPSDFIWSLAAPPGHLPLTNQLRGVRVMDALMKHPAWDAPSLFVT
jgi:hypothetical protein